MAIGFMSFGGMLTGGDEAPKQTEVAVAATEAPKEDEQEDEQEGLTADATQQDTLTETQLAATEKVAQDTNTVNE
jgi:Na+-transporting NADH:ubiquinone oxidoreductase subunit E